MGPFLCVRSLIPVLLSHRLKGTLSFDRQIYFILRCSDPCCGTFRDCAHARYSSVPMSHAARTLRMRTRTKQSRAEFRMIGRGGETPLLPSTDILTRVAAVPLLDVSDSFVYKQVVYKRMQHIRKTVALYKLCEQNSRIFEP